MLIEATTKWQEPNNRMLGMSARRGLFVSAFLAVSVVYQVVMSVATKSCYSFRMSGREKGDNVGRLMS